MRRANGLSSSSTDSIVVAGTGGGTYHAESNDVLASLMEESKEFQHKQIQRLDQATQQQPGPAAIPESPELSFDKDFFAFDSGDNYFFRFAWSSLYPIFSL